MNTMDTDHVRNVTSCVLIVLGLAAVTVPAVMKMVERRMENVNPSVENSMSSLFCHVIE